MSLLAIGSTDVHLSRRERSSVTVSDFSIDALISGDFASTRRRASPVSRPPFASVATSHDVIFCGDAEASTPPPTPPGLRQLPTPIGWFSQINLSAMRRLLPAYQLNSLTAGKNILTLFNLFNTM